MQTLQTHLCKIFVTRVYLQAILLQNIGTQYMIAYIKITGKVNQGLTNQGMITLSNIIQCKGTLLSRVHTITQGKNTYSRIARGKFIITQGNDKITQGKLPRVRIRLPRVNVIDYNYSG